MYRRRNHMSVEDERRRVQELNARVRAEVGHRGVRSARDSWVLSNAALEEQLITAVTRPVVAPHIRATCSKQALNQLDTLLDEIHAWTRGLVGLGNIEADALYNGDPMAMLLRDELIAWAIEHARARLARRNPKDQDDPFRKWVRLNREICGWLDAICLEPGPRVALSEVPDRIAAEIWDSTVGPELRFYPGEDGRWIDYGRLNPQWYEAVHESLLLYTWNEADALALARAQFASRAVGEPEALLQGRRAMAEDIVEARALIIGTYDPLSVVCAQPGGWTSFDWDLHHSTGFITLAATLEKLAAQSGAGHVLHPLRVHLDGSIAGYVRWWERADDPAWEVALLEPLHARLVEAWLARVPSKPPEDEPLTPAAAVAAVADACQWIAEPVEGHRIPAVRMQVLLRLLERRFSCEVGAGKGSEVTVYRPGGRKFTLGHHTRNTHVPAHLIRALLKAVGISVTEWWRTCSA